MMMQEPLQRDEANLAFASTPRPDEGLEVTTPDEHRRLQTRDEQLDALRTDVISLGSEVIAIWAGTSRLAALEATVALDGLENAIRRHLAPVLIAAGAMGYFWSAFLRRR